MIQRSAPVVNLATVTYTVSRADLKNVKHNVKEKKAAKRKEKSRVAAQIRRNKESQTLILLQNALPLGLPSPSQMLEKSIVIRIAGQTLFLMNTLDQVLGMKGWLTIPLMSNHFISFFMDGAGNIAYVSPNIQLLMEQYHWSNLIGMSIYDIVDFKSSWPTNGEVVRLRLPTNPTMSPTDESFSWSPSHSQASGSRGPFPPRLNIRKNSQTTLDCNSATCSLFHVWCHANISHTNTKLKLLVLQAVHIKSSILNSGNESSKPLLLCKSSPMSLQRSISCPSMSVPVSGEQHRPLNSFPTENTGDELPSSTSEGIYQRLITSAHDRYLYFKSASYEFCHLIGESCKSLATRNFLDIVHLEDVIEIKSILDQVLVIEDNDMQAWTPIYRIVCQNGTHCTLKTLAKHFCTASSDLLILRHLIIEGPRHCQLISKSSMEKQCLIEDYENQIISRTSTRDLSQKKQYDDLYNIRSDQENIFLKRKFDDKKRTIVKDKYVTCLDRTFSVPVAPRSVDFNNNQFLISSSFSYQHPSRHDRNITSDLLVYDPFLPVGFEKGVSVIRKSLHATDSGKSGNTNPNFSRHEKRTHRKLDCSTKRSPSYSLESCVLTSPGSECTDIPIGEHFIWESGDNINEITQLNDWLDEQFQTELDLILPI